MNKITAVAPANIAFIKYWGKRSNTLRIPLNDSISMNISGATTTTTVEFQSHLTNDVISFIGDGIEEKERLRIQDHLTRIRKRAHIRTFAKVVTKNSFPKGVGIASSASGFAALTIAATNALHMLLTEEEQTILARIGSGSACRSIPDGIVWWHAGRRSSDSYAESLYPSSWWRLCDVLCVVSKEAKKISSTEGMDKIKTSPYWRLRVQQIPEKIERLRVAMRTRNIDMLGSIIEEDAISMHCVMMTQKPPLFYWNDATLRVMDAVYELRRNGVPAYYTIDAGPNVHIICERNVEGKIYDTVRNILGVQCVIRNTITKGAGCNTDHLF